MPHCSPGYAYFIQAERKLYNFIYSDYNNQQIEVHKYSDCYDEGGLQARERKKESMLELYLMSKITK